MSIRLPLPSSNSVRLEKPSFTLDVNQIALRGPSERPTELQGLTYLEWNYSVPQTVELYVTPQTQLEITQGVPLQHVGSVAYQRFAKSELFKRRPPGVTLDLTTSDSDELWIDMRYSLFPGVDDHALSENQIADVNQVFFHAISSGTAAENSAFVTLDGNFIRKAGEFHDKYGLAIMSPNEAWSEFAPTHDLAVPEEDDVQRLWQSQRDILESILADSS